MNLLVVLKWPKKFDLYLLMLQLCDLLKSKVVSLEFLQNLDGIDKSVHQNGAGTLSLLLDEHIITKSCIIYHGNSIAVQNQRL